MKSKQLLKKNGKNKILTYNRFDKMKKLFYLLVLCMLILPIGGMAQGLHFGLKGGILGNKSNVIP